MTERNVTTGPGATATDPATDAVLRGRLVAILRAGTARHFATVGAVLIEAGVTAVEATLTTPGALDAIARLAREAPSHVRIGAGTVLTGDEARACVDAGASFLVSPVVAPQVIAAGAALGVPTYAGALSPTEVHAASRAGAPIVKLFPASAVGPGYLRDLRGPLPDVRIMPTGGIGLDDIGTWLAAGAVAVGLGRPLVGDAADGGSLDALRGRARRAVAAAAVRVGS